MPQPHLGLEHWKNIIFGALETFIFLRCTSPPWTGAQENTYFVRCPSPTLDWSTGKNGTSQWDMEFIKGGLTIHPTRIRSAWMVTKSHWHWYPCPTNINYFWNIGFLLITALIHQIISGMLLVLHYIKTVCFRLRFQTDSVLSVWTGLAHVQRKWLQHVRNMPSAARFGWLQTTWWHLFWMSAGWHHAGGFWDDWRT